jgi:hypothetical protein
LPRPACIPSKKPLHFRIMYHLIQANARFLLASLLLAGLLLRP